MEIFILVVFVLGYIAIATEHSIKIDKAASALITGVLCWSILVVGASAVPEHLLGDYGHMLSMEGKESIPLAEFFDHRLLHHLQEIAGIL
ncbi:MAG: sodium:proton antiporter, partial [Flavobacteriales bacterium]